MIRAPQLPQPRESANRCALRAQLRGDPMVGTAMPADRLLLVEQPGPWGPAGLRESRFSTPVAVELEKRAAAAGVRVLTIRRYGRTPRGIRRRWGFADTRDGHVSLRWGQYDADDQLLGLPLDDTAGTADDVPVYLVCAHSKHDACCALRGRSVAAALLAERPGHVWECSHVGGERFAANVLVLPSGLQYGRVLPFAAPEFVAATEAGEVIGALLRGRIGLAPVAQAALAFGYEYLAVRKRDALRVVSASPIVDGLAQVRLDGPHGPLEVTIRVETVAADGLTCKNARPNVFRTYHAVRIAPAGLT